jgi:hypothetical protein
MTDFEHQDNRMAEPASAAVEPTSAANARSARRRWFQYSLRTLFVVSIAAALGIVAAWKEYVEPYQRERQLEAMLTELGGKISTEAVGPSWVQRLLGRGKTNAVTSIAFEPLWESRPGDVWTERHVNGDLLYRMGRARALRSLNLQYCQFAEDDLRWLAESESLETLDLIDTAITDRGARHLSGLKNLRFLRLQATAVTDAALADLAAMPKLELLVLHGTNVSKAGLDAFRQQNPGVKLLCLKVQFLRYLPDRKIPSVEAAWGQRLHFREAEFLATNLGDEEFSVDSSSRITQGILMSLPGDKKAGLLYCGKGSDFGYGIGPGDSDLMSLVIPLGESNVIPLRCGPCDYGRWSIEFPSADNRACVYSDLISLPSE